RSRSRRICFLCDAARNREVFEHAIHHRAGKHRDSAEVKPEKQDNYGAQRAVSNAVSPKEVQVNPEADGHAQPKYNSANSAWRHPVPLPIAEIRSKIICNRKRQ